MVDKNWTLEQAKAANEKFLTDNPSMFAEPTIPINQWVALHELDELKSKFINGDTFSLMTAIRKCANHDLTLPAWAACAFISAYDLVAGGNKKSWDIVFGLPYPKGTHLNAFRKRHQLKYWVWLGIKHLRKTHPEIAIDEALFELVGQVHNIGKTLASEYYYEVDKEVKQVKEKAKKFRKL